MKKVILLSAKIDGGKNTFASFLKNNFTKHGLSVKQDLFAKGVKDGCKKDFSEISNFLNQYTTLIKNGISKLKRDVVGKMGSFGISDKNIESTFDTINKALDRYLIYPKNWYEDKTEITRRILQAYGTDIFRNRVDDNWWIKQQYDRVKSYTEDIIIITDVRFPNEINGLYSDDWINIPIRLNRTTSNSDATTEHYSEVALDDFDEFLYIIDNNSNLEELKHGAETLVEEIIKMDELC